MKGRSSAAEQCLPHIPRHIDDSTAATL